MSAPLTNVQILDTMNETDLRELFAFIMEQRDFDRNRLDTVTKQNERASVKGRIEALDDILVEARIIARTRARIEALTNS